MSMSKQKEQLLLSLRPRSELVSEIVYSIHIYYRRFSDNSVVFSKILTPFEN